MLIETACNPFRKLKVTNFTTASFGSLTGTLVEPTGDGVIDIGGNGGLVQNAVILRFFGSDTADETANARVWGWDRCYFDGGWCWEATLLAELALTLGDIAGVAGCAITASDLEVDTLVVTYGNANVSTEVVSPGNDVRGANALVNTKGFRKLQIEFSLNSSSASVNALYKLL